MTDNIDLILTEIFYLYGLTRQPIKTRVLADIVGYSDRHMRRKLNYLKDKGVLDRKGTRGGWYPSQGLIQFMSQSGLAVA